MKKIIDEKIIDENYVLLVVVYQKSGGKSSIILIFPHYFTKQFGIVEIQRRPAGGGV